MREALEIRGGSGQMLHIGIRQRFEKDLEKKRLQRFKTRASLQGHGCWYYFTIFAVLHIREHFFAPKF